MASPLHPKGLHSAEGGPLHPGQLDEAQRLAFAGDVGEADVATLTADRMMQLQKRDKANRKRVSGPGAAPALAAAGVTDTAMEDTLLDDMLTPHARLGRDEGFMPVTAMPSGNGSMAYLFHSGTTGSSGNSVEQKHLSAPGSARGSSKHSKSGSDDGDDDASNSSSTATSSDGSVLTPHARLGRDEGFIPVTAMPSGNGSMQYIFSSGSTENSGSSPLPQVFQHPRVQPPFAKKKL